MIQGQAERVAVRYSIASVPVIGEVRGEQLVLKLIMLLTPDDFDACCGDLAILIYRGACFVQGMAGYSGFRIGSWYL